LARNGKLEPYWVESGNPDMLVKILKTIKESEKQGIINNLLYGEVTFTPLKDLNWQKMK